MPWDARYSTIACVVAAMCASLNAVSRLDPRCPEVPKATCWSGLVGIGRQVVVGADDRVDVDQVFGEGRLAGAGVSHGGHSADTACAGRGSPVQRADSSPSADGSDRRLGAGFDRMVAMSSSSFSRPGAVDLSQLAARPSRPPPRTAGRGAGWRRLVRGRGDRADLRGRDHPPVDASTRWWSSSTRRGWPPVSSCPTPWPTIANSSDGKFLLARLNVDTAPGHRAGACSCRPCRR